MRISDWSSDVCSSDLIKSGVTSWGRALLAQLTDVEDVHVGIILILARHRPDEGIGFRARADVQMLAEQAKAYQVPFNAKASPPPGAPNLDEIKLIDYDFKK